MDERCRVVFFHIGRDVIGGGSKMLLRLLTCIDRSRFDPVLVSQTDDELCKRAREEGVHVEIVPFRGTLDTYNRELLTTSPMTLFATGARIVQFNADVFSHFRRADVIWCKNLRAVLTLLPYVLGTRTPVIWNIGLGFESDGSLTYMNELALWAVDHVFIESDDQAQAVFTEGQYQRYRDEFTTFHKGIDLERFDPDSIEPTIDVGDGLCVGTAASLTPRKGLEYLVEAIPRVLEDHDDVTFFIAGEAPEGHEKYARELRRRVEGLGVGDSVRFLGWVEDMPGYLAGLDVFVLSSLNEGIPGAVREALAMEVPVVATDVGGTSTVVVEGETGTLVSPRSSEEIARGISDLLSDPAGRMERGQRGRDLIATEFSMEGYVDRYEDFILTMM
ncbi:glycosyltransferase family 4 protein [Saliphagus infecundisoli]|uniref:Glycosyltransferase family 4 protein n=1 Tax=Saliphagus infecundisoli TaxID=1849069 RepID=A0ABD5QKZ6_9EURY|nr:glycosyltransferase family 4 protein [Saliphagus infecundisoli]